MLEPRKATTVVALCLLVFAVGPVFADRASDRAAERARKKAWEEAKEAFTRDYKSDDPKVRRAAVRKLADFTDVGAVEILIQKVVPSERSYGVLDAAIQIVGTTKDEKIIQWLVRQAKGKSKWLERTAIVEAMADITSPEVDETLAWLVRKESDSRVLAMALTAVGEKGMAKVIDDVIPHLEHDDWQVRLAAIEALGGFKDDKAIIHLIDRLMNERGRLRFDIETSLKKLTGKDFGRDANRWRKWFHERGLKKDEPPEGPPPEGNAGGNAGQKPGEKKGGGSVVKEPTYFGIKVVSDRVLFIIDVSKSMKTPIDVDKMKLMRDAATTGEGNKENKDDERFEQSVKWWKIKDRLDLAKAHLSYVIKNLGAEQQFEMVSFSEKIIPWNGGRVIKAKTRNKLRAINWIEELKVEEATAAGAALDFAFEMAGPGAADKNYKTGVDTIFFLSDGAPSDRSGDEILEEIRGRNRLRKIRIHVIAILNYSTAFLRKLAEQNGGVYKFFKVEDKE